MREHGYYGEYLTQFVTDDRDKALRFAKGMRRSRPNSHVKVVKRRGKYHVMGTRERLDEDD